MGRSFWVSIIIGIGVALVGGAMGTIASVWPQYIRPHPYWVITLLATGVVLIASPLLGLLFARTQAAGSTIAAPTARLLGNENENTQTSAQGDASAGAMNKAGGDLHAPHYHAGRDLIVQPTPTVSELAPFDEATDPKVSAQNPRLTIGPIGKRRIEHGFLDRFEESPNGKIGVSVWIANDRTTGKQAHSVGVSLTFRSAGELAHHVNRAFWFGVTEFERDLTTGTREQALVCMCYGKVLGLYQNDRKDPLPFFRTFSHKKRMLESFRDSQPINIAFEQPLDVEIAAIDSNGYTIGIGTFRLTPVEGQGMLTLKEL